MKHIRRVISFLLALVMIISILPSLEAFAQDYDGNITWVAAYDNYEFTDVPEGEYYYDAVMWAVQKEITNGTGDGTTFDPDSGCTRGQIATFLWRAAGEPAPESTEMPFKDVPADEYFSTAVIWAAENSITTGTGDGTIFEPNATCTRGQIVTFLSRYLKGTPSSNENPFKDVPNGEYYTNAVLWAVEKGITNGVGDGTAFEPNNTCTRGMIVTFLYRALFENVSEEDGVAKNIQLWLSETECTAISGATKEIYFYAEPDGIVNGITLLNAVNNEILLTLVDDGKYSVSGDDLPGDNIYSGKLTVSITEAEEFAYYASAIGVDSLKSETVTLYVYGGLNDNTLEEMDIVKATFGSSIFGHDDFDIMTSEEKALLARNVLEDLVEQNLIMDGSTCYNEGTEAFTFTYESGVLGVLSLREFNTDQNGFGDFVDDVPDTTEETNMYQFEDNVSDEVPWEDNQENIDENFQGDDDRTPDSSPVDNDSNVSEEAFQEDCAKDIKKGNEAENNMNSDDDDRDVISSENQMPITLTSDSGEVEENPYYDLWLERMNAIPLSPYVMTDDASEASEEVEKIGEAIVLWSFNQVTDKPTYREPFYDTLETDLEALGLETTISWNTTVNEYKKLKGYDVILFSGHGSYYTFYTPDGAKATLPTILLSEEYTQAKSNMYQSDLLSYRVCEFTFSYKDNSGVKQYQTVYGILPNFFGYYYSTGDLDGSFIYAENCMFRGRNNAVSNLFSDKLIEASAESVIGFHNSVMADYSRDLMKEYVVGLCNGETSEEAFETAKDIYDEDDYNYRKYTQYAKDPIAYPIFSGNKNASLINTGLQNGDFEQSSSAVSWTQVGDTRILSQLASLVPTSNKRMAILTTGIGSAEEDYLDGTEGSVLSQKFKIPENVSTLMFSYDIVSEEPAEFVGSSFNDGFQANLIVSNKTVEMASEYINTSTWYAIDGINFDGGDDTTYHTTWKTVSYDVSEYAGQIVTIQFVVFDVGDSIYDTAALIDNIYLS